MNLSDVGPLGAFGVSLTAVFGLVTLLLRRTFSDKDTHQAGYAAGRRDTRKEYRRAIEELVRVNGLLVGLVKPEHQVEAAQMASRAAWAALHAPAPEPTSEDQEPT